MQHSTLHRLEYQFSDGVYLQTIDERLNLTTLLKTTRDLDTSFNAHEYFLAHNLTEEYMNGAGYDEFLDENNTSTGHRLSRAPIYYNVIDSGNNTWTFNYFFYYAFHGYSNMISVPSNGTRSYTPFLLSPVGMHEGDWEGTSVKVCQTSIEDQDGDVPTKQQLPKPIAITYRQHDFTEITDCTQGECHFFEDSYHPMGFVALFSHATYPFPSYNHVYHRILLSLFLVDRTNYLDELNKMSFFQPNATNVIRLLNPQEVNFTTPRSQYWNAFGGQWGDITSPNLKVVIPDCLNENQTAYVPCPTKEQDPVFYRVMQMIGVYPPDDDSENLQPNSILAAIADFSAHSNDQSGPVTKLWFHEETPPINAPIWDGIPQNTIEEEYCSAFILVPDTGNQHVEYHTWNIKANMLGVLSMCILLPVGTSFFLLWFSNLQPNLMTDEGGDEIQPPNGGLKSQIYLLSFAFTVWYAIVIMGAAMFALSYDDIFYVLLKYFPVINWDMVIRFLSNLCIIFIIIDSLLVVLLWLPSYVLQKRLWHVYYLLIDEHENAQKYGKGLINLSFRRIQIGFIICFGFLLISMMLAVVFVVVSMAVVGFSYSFSEVCSATVTQLVPYGTCIDLTAFGADEVRCGEDFRQFCNAWVSIESSLILWGACIVAVGHYYLIGIGGMAFQQQVTVNQFVASMEQSIANKDKERHETPANAQTTSALLDDVPSALRL